VRHFSANQNARTRWSARQSGIPNEEGESMNELSTSSRRVNTAEKRWGRFIADAAASDLLTIVALCLSAVLFMLDLILGFPGLGAVIEQYHQF
jgi:hypothetical protein